MAKKYKRYDYKTDRRVNLYDYEVKPKGKSRYHNVASGRVYDVSKESLINKMSKRYDKRYYTYTVKRIKTNKQLRKGY